jgi:hypothetical protein
MFKVFGGIMMAAVVIWIAASVIEVEQAQSYCTQTGSQRGVCGTADMRELIHQQQRLDSAWSGLKDTLRRK